MGIRNPPDSFTHAIDIARDQMRDQRSDAPPKIGCDIHRTCLQIKDAD